jgi:uncharacterized repeat protein (TIGR03803 family)
LLAEQLEPRCVPTIITLATFNGTNGANPQAGLIQDSSGNLFGTAAWGGASGYGTVFEVQHGSTTITALAAFNGTNGAYPEGGLVEDSSGNLFGTTVAGGADGDGTVFEVRKGSPAINTLASFIGSNGNAPAGLVEDSSGDLLGTTSQGGLAGDGTVFEVRPGSGGLTTLATFNGLNGSGPGGLVEDPSGNLFGITGASGPGNPGTVFEVQQGSDTITPLALLSGIGTPDSSAGPVEDSGGNLFGIASHLSGRGLPRVWISTVFEVPAGSGTVLTLGTLNGKTNSNSDLVEDSSGNLFGTLGSAYRGGTVFEVKQGSGAMTALAGFNGTNGDQPSGTLVEDASGNLYGTTQFGGIGYTGAGTGYGTVFEVQPSVVIVTSSLAAWTDNQPGYDQTISATDGTGAISFTQTSGTLPPGLTLSSTGVLSGTPTATGKFSFAVTAIDSTSATSSASYTVTINPPVTIAGATLPSGTTGSFYAQSLAASGGSSPLTFSASGSLPPGMTLSSSGELSGTPSAAGTFSFTVTAIDTTGASASQAYTLAISLALSPATLTSWTANQPGYLQTITAPGGSGTITFTLAAGSLPTGLTLSSSGLLSGTPTAAGFFNFTIQATDSSLASYSESYALVINYLSFPSPSYTFPRAATVGCPYDQTITPSNGTGSITVVQMSGTLPPGVMLSSSGVLSGTPTAAGTFSFTVQGSDMTGAMASATYNVVVYAGVPYFTTVASFDGANGSGYDTGLVEDSSGNLFGTTETDYYGTGGLVFEIPAGTSTMTTLAAFNGSNGTYPVGPLLEDSAGNLFGITADGILPFDYGTVFEVKQGSGTIITLATFNGSNGASPNGLVEDRSGNLFGTTTEGGTFGYGTVFELPQGSGTVTVLASFPYWTRPNSGLIVDSKGNLFGTTQNPSSGDGTVFEVTQGSGTILTLDGTDFGGYSGEPSDLQGGLTEDSQGDLFGTTLYGGLYRYGSVFELTPGSSTVTTLASFDGTNGYLPYTNLVEDSSGDLFGSTLETRWDPHTYIYGDGTVFELQHGSHIISTVIAFNGIDGTGPRGSFFEDGNGNLFGTTEGGGASGYGNVFRYHTPPVVASLVDTVVAFNGTNGTSPQSLIEDGGGNLFGITQWDGPSGHGTVFEVKAGTGTVTNLADNFLQSNTEDPIAGLIEDGNGNLFGAAVYGGTSGYGSIFEVQQGSGTITTLASFNSTNEAYPRQALVEDRYGDLFGTTIAGGAFGDGTVFEVQQGSGTITILASFNGTNGTGFESGGSLVVDSSGNLFGTSPDGGADWDPANNQYGDGTVFEIEQGSNTITTLAAFNGINGAGPAGGLIADSSGNLFGVTYVGGLFNLGTVFELNKGTGAITTLASFNGTNGAKPGGSLNEDRNGNLFGTTSAGGVSGQGTAFEVRPGSGAITTLASFDLTNVGNTSGLVEDSRGNLFGTSASGGPYGDGTVYEVRSANWTADRPGYQLPLNAMGGTGVYTFAATAGTLPPGLSLNSRGLLSGTPTATGTYSFTITATDSVGATGSENFTVTINPAVSFTPATLANGTTGAAYNQTIAQGGTGSLTFSVTGTLPPGLGLNSSGALSGTPTTTGSFTFTLTATDVLGVSASQRYTMAILSISPLTLPTWPVDASGYSQTFTAGGGSGSYTFSVAGTLPSGLTLSPTGVLSGTPTAAGVFTFTVIASDSTSLSAGQAETMVINTPITLPSWTVNTVGYSQTVTPSGGSGALTLSETGTLPPGLSFSSTGVLSGTPTMVGSFTFTVTATNSMGEISGQTYTLMVNPPVTLSPAVLRAGEVGVPYNLTINTLGGTGSKNLSVTNVTGFINGLSIPSGATNSLDIFGTPLNSGTETIQITATDAAGATSTQDFTVQIFPAGFFLTPALPDDTLDTAYNQTIRTSGGAGSITFSATGPLPTGLTLSSSGVLSGTPTAIGVYHFSVTATDTLGVAISQAFTISTHSPVMITTTTLADWTVNQPTFNQTITATGGTGTVAFATTAGTLPVGQFLISNGLFTGKPTVAGNYTFTVTATDSAGASSSQTFTVVINPVVSFTSTSLPFWTVNQPGYSQIVGTAGGTGTKTFSATDPGAPGLPAGLTLSSNGVLSGTPTVVGSTTFTVTATDITGSSASQNITVTINTAPALSPVLLPGDTVNIAYNQTITVGGGTGTVTLTVTGLTPLPGLSVPGSGTGALDLSGTPTATGTASFTVTATDMAGASTSQNYTVVVNPPVSITTTGLATGTVRQPAYNQTITAMGGTGTLTFTAPAASLPPGLNLSSSGVLSGTPTSAGSFTFMVTATDAVGAQGTTSFTTTINQAISVSTAALEAWTAGLAGYSQSIVATGGTGSLTFSASGTLPTGLSLSSSGILSGTPTAAGSYTFTVTATDSLGAAGSQAYTLTINPAIHFVPGVLPTGLANSPYNKTISASGGTGAVSLVVSSITGAIPGITLPASATGSLSITGIPTSAGSEQFTLTATDQLGATFSSNFTITINPPTVYLSLPSAGFAGSPGGMVAGFPISINELQDQQPTNHVGLSSASFAVTFPTGVFSFPVGIGNASADVSLGSVPLSDAASPGGAGDWSLSATAPADGQLNITLTAKSGKSITTDTPAAGGSLVTINFPVSATYNPASPMAVPITLVSSNGTFHTVITGTNGGYSLKPTPPYAGSVTINSSGAGVFSQYLVSVVGSSTVPAGTGLQVSVQAADALGNPVTGYSGPASATASISPTSASSSFSVTVPINSLGAGSFLVGLQKVGSYTITVTNGSYTGSTLVTVTPGPAARLAFAAQPVNTPTGVTLPAVTVQVDDAYGNLVTSDNSDVVSLGIASGPGSGASGFTDDSTTLERVSAGVATFTNLTFVTPGSYTLSELVPALYTGPNSTAFTVEPLQVLPGSFAATPSEFSLQFNTPFLVNSVTPVLFGQGFGAGAPVPSITLTQIKDAGGNPVNNPVEGSLILNAATNTITFLSTNTAYQVNNGSPILPDGTYQVNLTSSAAHNGFQALNSGGDFLDGLGSGVAGSGDYTTTFTVKAAAAGDDVLWVPATADGPGQGLNAPGNNQLGDGYPIYLDDTTGNVTSVQVTVNYDPTLLNVTGVSGTGFTMLASSPPGLAVLQYSGPALAAGSETPIGFLQATVPAGTAANPTPYRAKDLLHLSNVLLNGGSIPVATSDGLHLVAYVGDADGNGTYSSNDAVLITRVALQTDTGFTAYPLVDPVIVGDTDGSGFIPADAALQVNEAGVGFATTNLPSPPIPSGVVFQPIPNNVDPTLSIPAALQVGADRTVTVPVNIDDAHPAGSTGLIEAHLALTYDPHVFTVSAADVHLGSVVAAGNGWTVQPTINESTGQIAIALSSTTPISSSLEGSLVTIDFHQVGTHAWESGPIVLVASVNPTGQQVVATELEDAQGTFTLTPAPVNGFDPRIDGVVTPPAVATISALATVTGEQTAINVPGSTEVDGPVLAAAEETPAVVSVAPAPAANEEEIKVAATESEPLHGRPASTHAPSIIVSAATFSLGNLTAVSATSLVAQVINVVTASVPSAAGADQFFQALARGVVNDGIGISPLLLPSAPADNLDNLNWDDFGSFQAALATRAVQQIPARRASVIGDTALPQAQPDQPALDQVLAQAADDKDVVGMDE